MSTFFAFETEYTLIRIDQSSWRLALRCPQRNSRMYELIARSGIERSIADRRCLRSRDVQAPAARSSLQALRRMAATAALRPRRGGRGPWGRATRGVV